MTAPRIRGLTPGERVLAREAFGDALALDEIRLLSAPWPFRRAFVPGRWFGRCWIVWPGGPPADVAEAGLRLQALLVHELTHVWQAQSGINLLFGKLRAGDGHAAYAYPLGLDCDWAGLNIEQQASVVEHRFLRARGVETPAAADFYERVCPLGR